MHLLIALSFLTIVGIGARYILHILFSLWACAFVFLGLLAVVAIAIH
jgi:hypothetical protein